jgi:hypothetical protein
MTSEDVTPNQKCIVCKSDINAGAKKCLKCNSRQDWLRFLDVGNTSISLLIAAVSVVALCADKLASAINFLSDPMQSSFTATLAEVNPKQISVFVSNRGPGAAVFQPHALCSIWATEKAETLYVGEGNRYYESRYPKPAEVAGRYIYLYGDEDGSSTIIEPGQRQVFKLKFREMLLQGKDVPDGRDEVKSYCTIMYKHENGRDEGLLRTIDSVNVSFFSLDSPGVQAAIDAAAAERKRHEAN